MKNCIRFNCKMAMALFSLVLFSFGCSKDDNNPSNQKVEDIDGNEYEAKKMCDGKFWMLKNLNVTRFKNGDLIERRDRTNWGSDEPYYAIYENQDAFADVYGRLYNWDAVNDIRGLAPEGWRIATAIDWQELIDCLGDESEVGGKLKEAGYDHWVIPNEGATDEVGFKALPGALMTYSPFSNEYEVGYDGHWWTSTEDGLGSVWASSIVMTHESAEIFMGSTHKSQGFSVRCVRN